MTLVSSAPDAPLTDGERTVVDQMVGEPQVVAVRPIVRGERTAFLGRGSTEMGRRSGEVREASQVHSCVPHLSFRRIQTRNPL